MQNPNIWDPKNICLFSWLYSFDNKSILQIVAVLMLIDGR